MEDKKPVRGEEETREFIKNNKNIKLVIGAFGDMENCTGIVERIIKPEGGGIFTKYLGCSYLFRGYPDIGIVMALRTPKAAIKILYSILSIKLVLFSLAVSFIVFRKATKKFFLKFGNIFIHDSVSALNGMVPKPKEFCPVVREFYRVATIFINRIKNEQVRALFIKVRDVLCTFVEYDSAYKFRLQDILPAIDIEQFKENPREELSRVFEILYERELIVPQMTDKYKRIERVLMFALRFKGFRNLLTKFLFELNFSEIKLSEDDEYFCIQRPDYNFQDLTIEERQEIKKDVDERKGHFRPKIVMEKVSEPKPI